LLISLSGLLLHVDLVPLCSLLQFFILLLVLDGNFWVLIETAPVGVILFEMAGDSMIQVSGSQRMAILLKAVHSLRHQLELHCHGNLVFLAIGLFSSPFERRCEIGDLRLHSVYLVEAPTGHVIYRECMMCLRGLLLLMVMVIVDERLHAWIL
jgi:hypothetical protein